jgi:ABC-type Fe3+/spermidine/putrescine transport system ATPase subunit
VSRDLTLGIRNVTVQRGGVDVVRGVDLDVAGGEVVALLGPSGSGKSSLLLAVAGLIGVAAGDVRVGDRDVTREPAHLRSLGMVFQDYALFPHYDVLRNVTYGLRGGGLDRAAQDAHGRAWLDRVGLDAATYAHRDVATLSGGQRQRVALARALAPDPPVLLLDEPFGALDRQLREQLLAECLAIVRQADGPAVLVVTHDRDEAMSMGDRVGVLRDGVLVQLDTPDQMWARPSGVWIARFLGHPNVLDARQAVVLGLGDAPLIVPPDKIELVSPDLRSDLRSGLRSGMAGGRAIVRSSVWRGGRRIATVDAAGVSLVIDTTGDVVPVGAELAWRLDVEDVVRLT